MSKMLALGGGALVGIACFLPLLFEVNGAGVSFAHVSMGVGMWVALVGGGVAIASDFVGRE